MIALEEVQVRAGTFHVGPLSLAVKQGEYLVILGPSGAGKTLLLEVIAGLRPCVGGRVLFDGDEAAALPPDRRAVGFVYQDSLLFPHLDVAANIAFGLGPASVTQLAKSALRRGRRSVDARVVEAARLVGADKLLDRAVDGLSGGEQQRVALARALVKSPKLLLLDEPLANLDQATREAMQTMLRTLHAQSPTTVLHVTHDFEEAAVLADRCAVVAAGRLHQVDTPAAVFRHPADAFVATFTAARNIFSGVVQERAADGAEGTVVLDDGPTLRTTAPCGGRVGVVVRPEDIELAMPSTAPADAGQGNLVPATVTDIVEHGSTALVRAVGAVPFTVLVTRRRLDEAHVRSGESVLLHFTAAAVHLFPAAGAVPLLEERLRQTSSV